MNILVIRWENGKKNITEEILEKGYDFVYGPKGFKINWPMEDTDNLTEKDYFIFLKTGCSDRYLLGFGQIKNITKENIELNFYYLYDAYDGETNFDNLSKKFNFNFYEGLDEELITDVNLRRKILLEINYILGDNKDEGLQSLIYSLPDTDEDLSYFKDFQMKQRFEFQQRLSIKETKELIVNLQKSNFEKHASLVQEILVKLSDYNSRF